MTIISINQLNDYRKRTFRCDFNHRLTSPQDAIDFVNQRGFVFLWPIKNVTLPSLWTAIAGDRPVADEHDDPGHISWAWKDQLLDKRVWYYARLLKQKNTFISNEMAPFFYALTPNYGSPEEDFYDQYQSGNIPLEAKLIFEALVKEGPLDTLSLRKSAHLTGKTSESAFNRSLNILQLNMKVLPVSICEAGRWHYAFVYDLTHRYYPELLQKAHGISESQARQTMIQKYLSSVGAASLHEIASLFHWSEEITERNLRALVDKKEILSEILLENQNFPLYIFPDLLN